MRTNLDLTPFYRSSIGFDRLFNLLEDASRLGTVQAWPAYDIARDGEDAYRISIAVPGFRPAELDVSQQPNLLVISGKKEDENRAEYLHRGIDKRSFNLRFELADYVEVASADLADGLLTVNLKRELPEAMKPRRIPIGAQPVPQLEARKAA